MLIGVGWRGEYDKQKREYNTVFVVGAVPSVVSVKRGEPRMQMGRMKSLWGSVGGGGTLRMIADVVMIEHNRDGERNDRTGN